MLGPQLCAKPRHFCKLDVATSRMAFLDINPIPTRLCHMIYCHGDKSYPWLVGIGLT